MADNAASRMALELKKRKEEERTARREAADYVARGGSRPSSGGTDHNRNGGAQHQESRMAIELRERREKERRMKRNAIEVGVRGVHGGHSGTVPKQWSRPTDTATSSDADQSVVGVDLVHGGDIQARMARELKNRKEEELLKKRAAVAYVSTGGQQARQSGTASMMDGDIGSRMALELKNRKEEDLMRKKAAVAYVSTGGHQARHSGTSAIEGDIGSRMAVELKNRKEEDLMRKKAAVAFVSTGGHQARQSGAYIEGDIGSRMAVELKKRREEEERRKCEAKEERTKGQSYCPSPAGSAVDVLSSCGRTDAAGAEEDRRRLELRGGSVSRRGEEETDAIYRSVAGALQMQMVGQIGGGQAAELAALRGKKKEALAMFTSGGDGSRRGGVRSSSATAELLALRSDSKRALQQYANRSDQNEVDAKIKSVNMNKQRELESLGCMRGEKAEAIYRAVPAAIQMRMVSHPEGFDSSQSPTAAELAALKGKKKEALEMFSGLGCGSRRDIQSSSTAAELSSLQGKKNEALAKFTSEQQSEPSQRNSKSTAAAELLALRGKSKRALQQYTNISNQKDVDDKLKSANIKKEKELAAVQGAKRATHEQLSADAPRSIQSSSSAEELAALRGNSKRALQQYTGRSDQEEIDDKLKSANIKKTKELAALKGIKGAAHQQLSADAPRSRQSSSAAEELAALRGNSKRALQQYNSTADQPSDDNLKSINDSKAKELEALKRVRTSPHEQLSAGSSISSPSSAAAELAALRATGGAKQAKAQYGTRPSGDNLKSINERKARELEALQGVKTTAHEQLAITATPKNILSSAAAAELESLRGKKQQAMRQYNTSTSDMSSDENLKSISVRKSKELQNLQGKKQAAEGTFKAAKCVEQKETPASLPRTGPEREKHEVKKLFDLVARSQCVGRDEVDMLLTALRSQRVGLNYTPDNIDAAFAEVASGNSSGRIGFDSFYAMYENLFTE